jgi:hypothetical protein
MKLNRNSLLVQMAVILFIFCLPYNNVPYIKQGMLKPLSIFPLALCTFILIYHIVYEYRIHFIVFSLLILYNLILIQFIDLKILELKPNRSPYIGLFQFVILGFFTISSFHLGQVLVRKRIFKITTILTLILLAFVLPLLFGFIYGLYSGEIPRFIFFVREILTSDVFPSGYRDRNAMLTGEPSWASIDICLIIIPTALILQKIDLTQKKKLPYIIILLAILNLFFTKSVTGVLLICAFILTTINFKKFLSVKSVLVIVLSFLLLFLLGDVNNPFLTRLSSIISSLNDGETNLEASGLTRVIFYDTFYKVFSTNPLGIGYSNEGFFYAHYMSWDYHQIPLVYDLAFNPNGRFADFKNFFMKIISNFGLLGLLLLITLFVKGRELLKKSPQSIRPLMKGMFVVFLTTSFTFNFIGYFTFAFLIGALNSYVNSLHENININS